MQIETTQQLRLARVVPTKDKKKARQAKILPLREIRNKPLLLCSTKNLRKKINNYGDVKNDIGVQSLKYLVKSDITRKIASQKNPLEEEDEMLFKRQAQNLKLKPLDYVYPDDQKRRRNFYSYINRYNKRHPAGSTFDDIVKFIESHRRSHTKASLASLTTALLRVIKLQLGMVANNMEENRRLLLEIRKRFKAPVNYKTKKALTLSEVCKLIQKAKSKASALAEFLFHTAMRIGDAHGISLDKCRELENGNWLISVIQKGQKVNQIEVRRTVFERVRQTFGGKKFLFESDKKKLYTLPSLGNLLAKEAKRILGPQVTTHDMRRAFATNMIKLGYSHKEIMKRMGIVSISIFMTSYVDQDAIPVCNVPPVSRRDYQECSKQEIDLVDTSFLFESEKKKVEKIPSTNDKQLLLFSSPEKEKDSVDLPAQEEPGQKRKTIDDLSFKEKEKIKRLRQAIDRVGRARSHNLARSYATAV